MPPNSGQEPLNLTMVEAQTSSEKTCSLSSSPNAIDDETKVVERNMESETTSIGPSGEDEVQVSADKKAPTEQPESAYITGLSLYAVLAGLTLVVFLSMLDQTIVVTVSVSLPFGHLSC